MKTIVDIAREYAVKCHNDTNHLYAGSSYTVHLAAAVAIGIKFINLIPKEERDNVLAAIWCHDVIEDCRQTYNDVVAATNSDVAEMVYAVTNEKGRNRKERASAKYYMEMRQCSGAIFIKLCDRIANIEHSALRGGDKLNMYKKENSYFCAMVDDFRYPDMLDYMNYLLYGEKIRQN